MAHNDKLGGFSPCGCSELEVDLLEHPGGDRVWVPAVPVTQWRPIAQHSCPYTGEWCCPKCPASPTGPHRAGRHMALQGDLA